MVRRGDRPHHALSARPVLPGRAVRHSACAAHTLRRLDGRLVWQAATDLCRYAGRRALRNLEGTGFVDLPQNPGHAETPAALAGWRDIRPLLRRMISAEWPKSNLAHVEIVDKTNEIAVAQALIADLKLGDCRFTFAMHCQKKTSQSAAAVGSRVLVQVTDNQPSLVDALANLPATRAPDEAFASSEKSRNRQEYRHVQVFHADGALDLPEWDEYALRAIRVYRKTWIKDTKTGGWDRREDISWY